MKERQAHRCGGKNVAEWSATRARSEVRPVVVQSRVAIALLMISLSLLPRVSSAADLVGRVVSVADGDTLTVLTLDKQQDIVRLNGIDAPESGQDFGQAAKRSLSALVFGKDVRVLGSKHDRYGRLVGTVLVDSVDVNLEQIRAGMAWFFRRYATDVPAERRAEYEEAEAAAREAKRGLWAQPRPVAPWEFRRPTVATGQAAGPIVGNLRSRVYHLPTCPDYGRVAERNRRAFQTEDEAQQAGFRKAGNCR